MKKVERLLTNGSRACQRGDWRDAKHLYIDALRINRNLVGALHGLGVVCLHHRQPVRAIVLLERGLSLLEQEAGDSRALKSALVFALNNAASDAAHREQWNQATRYNERSLELDQGQAHTLSNLSVARLRLNQLDEALERAQEALSLKPKNPEILNNYGTVLHERGALHEAAKIYQKVLQLDASNTSALGNLACVTHQLGDLELAEKLYRSHLKKFPSDTRVWVNLSGVLLSQGKWNEGWDAYNRRLDNPDPIMDVPPELLIWDGADHPVRKLVVVHEQGLGDCFQFSRFLLELKDKAQEVVFSGPRKLHGLIRSSGLIDQCWDPEDPMFAWKNLNLNEQDRWVPMMSLPHLLKQSEVFNKQKTPYLKATNERIQRWAKILRNDHSMPLIGLHWQGNPEHEFTISRGRSLSIKELEPLFINQNVQWLSLQKGPGSEQITPSKWRERFHPDQDKVNDCWDFEETAAILTNCDLVITSDSGLAHLAAGLGRPTWLLLMQVPEWRWGLKGSTTPWYPSMRLFRQERRNDWNDLIKHQVMRALKQWLDQRDIQRGLKLEST